MEQQPNRTLEEKYRFVENQRSFGEWIRKRLSWIILIISSVLFIFKEGLEFSASQDNVITLVMSMSFTYVFALYISISLRQMGKKGGKESTTFVNALKYLAEAKNNIKDIMYLLPRFIRYKNEKTLEDVKKLFIEENGLLYSLYLKGYYKEPKVYASLDDAQKKTLKEVSTIKITTLQPSDLLSEHSKSKSRYADPLYLGKDEKTDSIQATTTMVFTKALLPIITSYFAIQVAIGMNIIWGAIQVSIILLMGLSHYMEGEDYIVNELKNRQIDKADLLIEFKNLYEKDRSVFAEDEELVKSVENGSYKVVEIKEEVKEPEEEVIKQDNELQDLRINVLDGVLD
jgi:hypothetical protein